MSERVVLDASAGVEILNRTASGIQLARWLEAPSIEVWTVEHFHLEVAKVLRRYVLAGSLMTPKLVDGSLCSLSGSSMLPESRRCSSTHGRCVTT